MPIYEYECTCCACRFEMKRSFSDNTPPSCPRCGGKAQLVFSPVPVIFKGTGFYSTDNRDNHSHSSDEGKTEKPNVTSPENKSASK